MAGLDLTHAAGRSALNPVAAGVDEVARQFGVDPGRGLSVEEFTSPLSA
jgi:hypothetical protein